MVNVQKKYLLPSAAIALTCAIIGAGISFAGTTDKATASVTDSEGSGIIDGIGALGRIEPHSRVIRLSHDQGVEGASISKILVKEGQTVKAGDALIIFSDLGRRESEVKIANAKLDAALAQKAAYAAQNDIAGISFKRSEKLIKDNAISQAEYDMAKANLTEAKACMDKAEHDIELAKAEVELSTSKLKQSTVISPIDATILKIYKWAGERVGETQIMDIADITSLDVVAEIYESDFPKISLKQKAIIRIAGDNTEYHATVRETGYIVQKNDLNDTDPLADRDNRVIEVRLSLESAAVTKLSKQIFRQVQVQIFP